MARAPRRQPQPVQPVQPSQVDPNKRYRVYLNKSVRLGKYGETVLSPRTENVLAGFMLASIDPNDIVRYELVG